MLVGILSRELVPFDQILLFLTVATLVSRQAPWGSYFNRQYAITASSSAHCWIIQAGPNWACQEPNTTQWLQFNTISAQDPVDKLIIGQRGEMTALPVSFQIVDNAQHPEGGPKANLMSYWMEEKAL